MSVTPWVPTVTRINDGDTVDQATLNTPIDQLTQRDQHLYDKFAQIANKSVLVVTDQPVHPKATFTPGELSLAYYKADSDGEGLYKGTTGFSSSSTSAMFAPSISNYSFGLVKAVNTLQKTADLFIEGLCELDVPLDDAILGLIQKDSNGTAETFRVGPYYLSAKNPGKITSDPSGIPVYIGYAISRTKFILHTNVDEFSQFFINYRFHILDRVAGTPSKSGAGVWTITSTAPDLTKLGWVGAVADSTPGAPTGAVFRYNIPSLANLTADTQLTAEERVEANELNKNLPPVPANFNQLYINGALIPYNDPYDLAGKYSVNEYGIWWHSNTDPPWASNYPPSPPTAWTTTKATISATRKLTFMSFAKFNPALRTQLVSSLTPLNTTSSKASNFIKFYSKDNPALSAVSGDLLVDIEAPVIEGGYAPLDGDLPTKATYPTSTKSTFTANRAVAGFEYSKEAGAFKAVVTPVVARIKGTQTITVTETPGTPGEWQINYLSEGTVGMVDSIEPINARLEFRGLSSYIKLPAIYTTSYGFIGKIVLPQGSFNNKDLRLAFHLFGDSAATTGSNNVTFNFEYSTVPAVTSGRFSATDITVAQVGSIASSIIPATFQLAPSSGAAYSVAYTALKVTPVEISIPAASIKEDTIVNFRITRVAPAASPYSGNIGVLATYWFLPTA